MRARPDGIEIAPVKYIYANMQNGEWTVYCIMNRKSDDSPIYVLSEIIKGRTNHSTYDDNKSYVVLILQTKFFHQSATGWIPSE